MCTLAQERRSIGRPGFAMPHVHVQYGQLHDNTDTLNVKSLARLSVSVGLLLALTTNLIVRMIEPSTQSHMSQPCDQWASVLSVHSNDLYTAMNLNCSLSTAKVDISLG